MTPYPSICSHNAAVLFPTYFPFIKSNTSLTYMKFFIKIMSHITPWILQLTKDHRTLDKLEFQYSRSKSFKYHCSHFPGGLNWNWLEFTQVPTWKNFCTSSFFHKVQEVTNTILWLHTVPWCPRLERRFFYCLSEVTRVLEPVIGNLNLLPVSLLQLLITGHMSDTAEQELNVQ